MENTESKAISLQNSDVRNKIRTLYLKGLEIKQIQEELQINDSTWDSNYWENRQGFRDFMLDVKKNYFISEAERVSKEIQQLKPKNARELAIKQKEAEFLRETQGKDLGYSKRIETIGLNINKNEPLDDEQKRKLNKLFKVKLDKNAETTATDINQNEGFTQ